MSRYNIVVRHATAIILMWVIIAAVSAPLSTKIENVTEFNAERLLPNGTDSTIAEDLLSKIMNSGKGGEATLAYDVILVRGVWTKDKSLIDWDKELSSVAGAYIEEYLSPYKVVREILDEIEPDLRNGTHEAFTELSDAYSELHDLYINRHTILENMRELNELVHKLIEWGQRAEENMSKYNEEADNLLAQLSQAKQYYINLSTAFNETINALNKLREETQELAQAVAGVDQAYSMAYSSAHEFYPQILELNMTAASVARLFNMTVMGFMKVVFDVARIHYYLLTHSSAYTEGLKPADVQAVINYTSLIDAPVSPEEVFAVYTAVMRTGSPTNVSIDTIYYIAEELASSMMPTPEARMLVSALSTSMMASSKQLLTSAGLSNYDQVLALGDVEGQAALASHLRQALKVALPSVTDTFADALSQEIAEQAGMPWASEELRNLIAGAALLGYPPSKEGLEELVTAVVAQIASNMTGEPVDYLAPLIKSVYEMGPTPEAVATWLRGVVSSDPRVPAQFVDPIVNTVVKMDPGGTAYLTECTVCSIRAAANLIADVSGLDPVLVTEVASSNGSLVSYAVELMKERIPSGTVPGIDIDAALRAVAESGGRVSPDSFALFIKAVMPDIPETLAKDLAARVWEESLTREDVLRFILIGALVEECFAAEGTASGTEAEFNITVLPIIDAIINGNFSIEAVADTVEVLARPDALPGNVSVTDLVAELAKLPQSATDTELIEAMSSVMGEGGENVLDDILVNGRHPLQVISETFADELAEKMDIEASTIMYALEAAIILDNETVLWDAVWGAVEGKIFDNVTAEFEGRMISPEGDSFIIVFKPRQSPDAYENALSFKSLVREELEKVGKEAAFVGVTGDDVLREEGMKANKADIDRVNKISIIAPVLIALAIIGGLVAAGLPFLGIGLSVLTSSAALYALSLTGLVDVTSWSRMLMITTSFGLGMDYSSYIVLRFKEKIAELRDAAAVAHDALMHSLPAIAAASSTDIIGFAVMMLAKDFPLLASIGKTVPIAILAVLAASLTFTPAVLARFGGSRWFWWPHRPEAGRKRWSGIRFTKGVAIALIVISAVAAGVGAYGLATFQGSHDYSVFMPEGTEGYVTYEALKAEFPAGQLLPVYVVGVTDTDVHDPAVKSEIESLVHKIEKVAGVEEVRWFGKDGDEYVGPDNKTFYFEVILRPSPLSREGIDVVRSVRDVVRSFAATHIKELHVGGVPAASLEMEELLERDFWGMIFPVSIVLMWLAMAASFRSVWSGTISLATIGIGYMLGVTAASMVPATYNQPALWFLPLMTFPAVLGVGMDYNSFFLNREREELEKVSGEPGAGYIAVTRAVRAVSHLVIGLGTIVAATYASLLIGSSWGVRELGLALTVGVVVTTLMAAIALTPALLALMSEKAWWPYSRRWRRGHGNA